jgi:hypothetical protein
MGGFADGRIVIEPRLAYADIPFEQEKRQEGEECAEAYNNDFFRFGESEGSDGYDASFVIIGEVVFPVMIGFFVDGRCGRGTNNLSTFERSLNIKM